MATELNNRISGPVFVAGDSGYAPEIAAFNTAIVHSPDLVVGAESAADVVEAVRFAREHGYPVSVQATGHTEEPITSGLLISTRRLDGVRIDPGRRTATIGAGTLWEAVVAAAAEHGLAPVGGSSTKVGVVGYLLGGGLGPLARSHGFSSDYLIELEVVTGEGELIEASLDHNPELFWALRGGKAGLGIVTEVRLRLLELSALYGGSLFFGEKDMEATLRAWVDWTAGADPLVSTSVAIVRFPPLDVVPEPFRGRLLLSLRFAYPGPVEEGARLAGPLRSAAPVYLDALGELPVAEVATIHNDPGEPSPALVSGMLLTHVDQEFASELLEQVGAGSDAPFVSVEIRHLGEATRRDVEGGSAVGGRADGFTLTLIAADPELFLTAVPAATDRLIHTLQPWISAETNINFAGKLRSAEQFTSAWPPDILAKLTEVREEYDPDGVLALRS